MVYSIHGAIAAGTDRRYDCNDRLQHQMRRVFSYPRVRELEAKSRTTSNIYTQNLNDSVALSFVGL